MKTVVTVLDERKNAKHRWPVTGWLASEEPHVNGRPKNRFGHCCLGCHALACNIPLEKLLDHAMPGDTEVSKSWKDAWNTELPSKFQEEILNIFSPAARERLERAIAWQGAGLHAGNMAAAINDDIACYRRWRKQAVKALRILFAYVGKQRKQKWIIRHYA